MRVNKECPSSVANKPPLTATYLDIGPFIHDRINCKSYLVSTHGQIQLLPTHDGFPECVEQIQYDNYGRKNPHHYDTGPDPPYIEEIDPPHCENTCDPPHWEN